MIDKQFFKSMHEEYCTQHQIIEDWYKSPTDDELIQLACDSFYGLIKKEHRAEFLTFARAVEELIRTKNEL